MHFIKDLKKQHNLNDPVSGELKIIILILIKIQDTC